MDKFGYQTNSDMLINKVEYLERSTYEKVKHAYENLLRFIWFEEKFRVLLDNFYEFEKDIYDIYQNCVSVSTVKNQIEMGQEGINLLNRRLLNFTASARMYIDEIEYDTTKIFKNSTNGEINKNLKKYKSEKYDSNVSYQLLELIRNICQHRGLLIRGITLVEPLIGEISITPIFVNIRYSDLKQNDNFKNKIKNKEVLERFNSNDLNIVHHIRSYIKDLFSIHEHYRELMSSDVELHVNTIKDQLKQIEAIKPSFEEVAFFESNKDFSNYKGILIDKRYIEKYETNLLKNKLNFDKYFLNKITIPFRIINGLSTENTDISLNMIYLS
ncbi:hypothetical protein [Paenibacillus xylanexedens]|uniref:hypothetical protein n=1 Tax=Paenibacillus xylanexedens TaxID=528191 RepID=UPI0011AB1141|nr:hypothetical protein [Paenibacillus xylanexedens]